LNRQVETTQQKIDMDSQLKNGKCVKFDLIAIAASAGGLEALMRVIYPLPADFPVAIAVVLHIAPDRESMLPRILSSKSAMKVKQAEDQESYQPGIVYVAPPDRHLQVQPGSYFALTQTPTVHYVRPSADVLFSSAAECLHRALIAVVLSGTGIDGSEGIMKVKQQGGVTIAQDENSSAHFGMPHSAISTGLIDFILPLGQISHQLESLVNSGVSLGKAEQ